VWIPHITTSPPHLVLLVVGLGFLFIFFFLVAFILFMFFFLEFESPLPFTKPYVEGDSSFGVSST
jgi:hypothetical protein